MRHPDIELLTQFALDDPLALDAATLVHITDCAECRHEIDQVQRVVDATLAAGGRADLRTLLTPSPAVWDRIVDELDAEEPAPFRGPLEIDLATVPIQSRADQPENERSWLFAETDDEGGGVAPAYTEPPPRRAATAVLQVLAAAVVGAIVGAGFTWVLKDNDTTAPPAAAGESSALQAIEPHTATGEITLSGTTRRVVAVTFDAEGAGNGFIEVWLLNPKTGGMVALGVLDGPTGEFAVPKGLDLGKYSEVDVSVEPYDGDPVHSTESLARGPLPNPEG